MPRIECRDQNPYPLRGHLLPVEWHVVLELGQDSIEPNARHPRTTATNELNLEERLNHG
jgi:hypothetical protein